MGLNPICLCPSKRRLEQRHTQRDNPREDTGRKRHLQAKERRLRRNQLCPHLDCGLSVCQAVKKQNFLESPHLWHFVVAALNTSQSQTVTAVKCPSTSYLMLTFFSGHFPHSDQLEFFPKEISFLNEGYWVILKYSSYQTGGINASLFPFNGQFSDQRVGVLVISNGDNEDHYFPLFCSCSDQYELMGLHIFNVCQSTAVFFCWWCSSCHIFGQVGPFHTVTCVLFDKRTKLFLKLLF